MFSMTGRIFRWFALLLLGLTVVSCGGGGGGGGFGGTDTLKVSITADKTTLQSNFANAGPNPSGPYTNTITVQIKKNDRIFPAPSVTIDVVSGLDKGALFYLDGDPEHEECLAVAPQTCPPVAPTPLAFRRLAFEDTSGTVTGHFHSSSTPGTVVLRAAAQDPDTSETIVADLTITVGPGVSTGQPALTNFLIIPSPLYITGQGREDVKRFQVQVLDDAGQPVPNPAGNNLQLQLLPSRPNGGEKLVAITASGSTQEGNIVNTRTINGVAEVALHSGDKPGTVQIAAIADRADNNVDNGIQNSVTDVDTIPIGSGEITSLTFTGPYPGAVAQRRNTLPLGDGDSISSATGVYSRLISVIAVDEFGNPPPPGEFITFRLMDGPMTGYPDQGRGVFTIAGKDGNPQEGGNTFTTPPGGSSLAGASTNCQLVLEGGFGQEGSWLVNGQAQPNLLAVFNTFNSVTDTEFTVPYTVGCPPYRGNVANNVDGVTVAADENGLASTIMNYPITQLGRCFKLSAEANGGRVGAVMGKEKLGSVLVGDGCTSWYLGIPTGAKVNVIPPSDQNLVIPTGGSLADKEIRLQLLDGAAQQPAPLPAEKLSVQMVITDPDKAAAIAAESALAVAQAESGPAIAAADAAVKAAQDAFTNAGCTAASTSDTCKALGEKVVAAQAALDAAKKAVTDAQAALAKAQACDAINDPTASFKPEPPNPLVTGVDGIATMTISVSGLYTGASTGCDNGDAKVEFFITTVGPEILADTLTITVSPQGAKTEEPAP